MPRAGQIILAYLRVLGAGLRLAILGRPRLDPALLTPGMLWFFALLGALLACGMSYLGVEPPRRFVYDGLLTESYSLVTALLVGYLLAGALAAPVLLWRLPVLLLSAGLLPLVLGYLAYEHLLPRWADDEARAHYLVYALLQLWWVGILYQALSLLAGGQAAQRRLRFSVYAVALVAFLSYPLGHYEFWDRDYRAEYERQQREQPKPMLAEQVLGEQHRLLADALAQLRPGEPGRTELFYVGFGGDGRQKVFMREVRYVARLLADRFGTAGHEIVLVNDRDQPARQPMASVTNLEQALQAVRKAMNLEEDILFLFLTSHGSAGHQLLVELGGVGLYQIDPKSLARILRDAGIRWRVIVISACYSGGFIEALKDDHSLVITSARSDRKSFGCEDVAEFTYFGRAYFEQGLNQTHSFQQAFHKASALVGEWEAADEYTASEPQMAVGKLIGPKLDAWLSHWDAGPGTGAGTTGSGANGMLESGADMTEP